ncbi:MAG: HlyD family efflux transporter periplasmic adaptor subunit [Aquabacterium sp.]|uniref:HlyD family secretion protein n=1 Tax=Aquabacterium sp. TaxID=1872578 RepID=UPI001219294F|nr:HlyD family efflux transporter periplasmic adaptor subunit [Aquabacterium sp.]TAK99721.1 MAG: HlyD family efflux transporter periplasmic adaptor subunit [Aquabacterium sp.]
MNPSLFRQDALEARADQRFGMAPMTAPLSVRWLMGGCVGIVVLALTWALTGHFTRKEHVLGYLMPSLGLIKLYAPQAGAVIDRRVTEGQLVHRGDVLMVVSSERATESTLETQAAMLTQLRQRRDSLMREQAKQRDIDVLTSKGLSERIDNLQTELEEAQAQLQLQQQRVAVAERTVARHLDLVQAHFVAEATVQEKQEALLAQRQQLSQTQRSITSLTRDLVAARIELGTSALKKSNNAAQLDRQMSELTQQLTENDAKRRVLITAPADGTVTTILAEPGQAVTSSAPLLSILPAGARLQAQLLVPTRAAGFVKLNQTVALRYQAFPYQRFGHHVGTVSEVGKTVIQPNEASLPVSITEPVYRVTVSLPSQAVLAYGQAMPLRSGMALDADIHVDRRRLVDWFIDPLVSISGRF